MKDLKNTLTEIKKIVSLNRSFHSIPIASIEKIRQLLILLTLHNLLITTLLKLL